MDLIEFKQIKKKFKRHPWEIARLKILLFFLKKFLSPKNIIADIGSGDAFIAKGVARAFPQTSVIAVDINYSKEIREALQEDDMHNTSFISNLHPVGAHTSSVNLVVLMDVLEHIEDPNVFLEEIKALHNVTSNTHFFITVPAFNCLYSKHDTVLGHYKRYSRKELIKLLQAHGLQIEFSGYFFNSLLIVRTLQKIFRLDFSEAGLYNWNKSKLSTSLITFLFWIEFKISWYLSRLRIYIPGLTCYCLCRRLP